MLTMFELCRAAPQEVRRTLPGDEVAPHPLISATHAITIDVPPDHVWPWLVQMGCDRAGWYSYDLLDNGERHSASAIVPTLQHLAIGDVMPAAPGARDSFRVVDFIPATMLLLGVPATNTAGGAGKTPASAPTYDRSWVFVLEETPAHHTRLITRGRLGNVQLPSPRSEKPRFAAPSEFLYASMMQLPRPALRFLGRLVHFIMQRKQLVGIKQRAEHQAMVGSSSVEEAYATGIGARE